MNDRLERQFALQVLDQDLVLGHDQHLGHGLVFEVAQGHAVFLEELDQVFARNASVLRSGDAVSLQAARVEPLADRARGHFTDLRDLTSCEDLHRRLSITLTLTRSWSYHTQGRHDGWGPLLVVLTGVSVLLAGCGCRPGTNNLGRGITTISFYVAEVQFLLIRALL